MTYATRIEQTLILQPTETFQHIEQVMQTIGWQHANQSQRPIVAGEPETASWLWNNAKPYVVYTYNPVCHLRVLDIATLPPGMRALLTEQLGVLTQEDIQRYLESSDEREQLLGLLAIQETQNISLLPAVRCIKAASDYIQRQMDHTIDRLESIRAARMDTITTLAVLAESAKQLIKELTNPSVLETVIPSLDDFKALFDEEVAISLYPAYVSQIELHSSDLPRNVAPSKVTAASAGLLRFPNELSEQFPLGYRNIAGWMQPQRIWITWTYHHAGEGRVRYDGLAWLDDHWVWIPKPFRLFSTLDIVTAPKRDEILH